MERISSTARSAAGLAIVTVLGLAAFGLQSAGARASAVAPVVWTDVAEGLSPLDLERVTFGQRSESFVLTLSTHAAWRPSDLDAAAGRSICVLLTRHGMGTPDAQLCARHDASRQSGLRLRLTDLDSAGRSLAIGDLAARVERVGTTGLRATMAAGDLRLEPGRYRWQARSDWSDAAACALPGACGDLLPDAGPVVARYTRPGRLVGCGHRGARQVTRATGSPREVALTFDDGPSAYTASFLRVLEREQVRATFFLVGNAVHGRSGLIRRMLRDGHMLANHSLTHANLGAGGSRAAHEMRRTQSIIRSATGFTPCLFRPPYGSTSTELVRQAAAQRLTTVLWDVDSQDWTTPGARAISGRIEHDTRRGSIVLMHDGGGPRGQTLAALASVIREFKRRNYRFVTVNEMLGLMPIRR